MSIVRKYGLRFDDMDDLQIEMACIRKGGRWKMSDGKEYGDGLFEHFRRLETLLWPDEDHHRWSDLMLQTILTNRITVVAGAKDSGKTHTMSKFALADYFCFPQETLTMMSSTDIRGLELRVWGDVKDLFDRARERWPYLPGNVVDAKHGIFTDALDDTGDVRDMRKGILCIPCIGSSGEFVGISKFVGVKQKRRRLLGDECFPAGTLVDTPSGPKPIETIQTGDCVSNATGFGKVLGVRKSKSMSLCRLMLSDGREILSTLTHKFLTQKGWVQACDLKPHHYMLSNYEAMQIVQDGVRSIRKAKVLQLMQDESEVVCRVWNAIHSKMPKQSDSLLQLVLQKQVADDSGRLQKEGVHERAWGKDQYCQVQDAQRQAGNCGSHQTENADEQSRKESGSHCKNNGAPDLERSKTQSKAIANSSRTEYSMAGSIQHTIRTNESGKMFTRNVSEWNLELPGEYGREGKQRIGPFLQDRSSFSELEARRRGRWSVTPISEGKDSRSEKGIISEGSWLAHCEILEQNDLKLLGASEDGITVYNLHIDTHHTYVVNGIVVSNCQFMQQSYLDSMANLDKGNFLGCFVGNPIGNGDPLDRLSEPSIGWDALGEVTKTMTWKNKFGGTTINFVGTDSPNFDKDRPKQYPYLIDQADVDRIGDRYGRDSALFWSQIMGVRKAGINAHRVLTMDMCNKYGAFDPCVWAGSDTIRVFGIDAGYGGDLCVGICAEFGLDVTGITALKFHEPVVIPVRLSAPEIVEDQIATFAKGECQRMGIPDEHVFIEAGMRATLAVSFSRIMSPKINAINFGGAATDRPVSNDLFILDERTGQRRHKKANEHYSKYVTQLYFSVRAAVESKQIRDLPKNVAEEFCLREWYMVHGDRYELETKLECKERMGVSPNYADAAAVACEGALRLGFQIERLKIEENNTPQHQGWLDKELTSERNKRSKYELKYQH